MAYPQSCPVQYSQGLVESSIIHALAVLRCPHPADLKNIDVDVNDIEVDTPIYINMAKTTIMPKFRGCGLDSVVMTGLNACTVQLILTK
jgi:hypothetical protein